MFNWAVCWGVFSHYACSRIIRLPVSLCAFFTEKTKEKQTLGLEAMNMMDIEDNNPSII